MRLEQVVSNLISNGRDAILSTTSKRGGIIRVSTNIKNNFVSLYVSDSGPGIKKGDIERIFDPFYTTKDAGQGTGLGLSIAYSIIKEHSGEINYLTLPNMGATFCITLPQLKS
ncbi:MAG: HAMP domain-containing histidine kinase [Bacteriovoracaceae bacterium]|nr:HAMP domain-containing histidine kinase [Bacteriovoracaceae bacterium]